MFFNFILLFSTYWMILFSIVGYGYILNRNILKIKQQNFGINGLTGIFFLILYSYISHFFFPHGIFHNSLVLILGIIFFLLFRNQIINNKNFNLVLILFFVIFISLLIFKTHDDFPYYHFPYTYYLTQNSLIVGVGQFNHGFRTHSSIFYLNSLFYLPIIKYYTFYIPTLIILGFANFIFLDQILKALKKNKINFIFYYCLLFIIFFNIFFYRIQEHGSDRSAQILISILFLYITYFFLEKKNQDIYFKYILITLGITISLKAFFIVYLILTVPVLIYLFKEKKSYFILHVLTDEMFKYFSILIFLVFVIYFLNTGCIIYPIPFTCFDNLDWSVGLNETIRMNEHYQLWSKAGKTTSFSTEDPNFYLKDFNWIQNWFDMYFFNKVSDFILGLLLVSLIVFFIFYKKQKRKIITSPKTRSYIKLTLFFLIILLFEWFVNHPSLRYGGYILVAFIFFIPLSLILESYKNKILAIKKSVIILLIITIIIFVGRNIIRINDEINKYDYKPLRSTFYYIDKSHFRIHLKFENLIENFNNCKQEKIYCDNNKLKNIKEIYPNKYLLIK